MTKQKFEDGIHDISNAAYHASDGVSRSALWKLRKSPAHYWHEYLNPEFVKPEPSPALVLGNLVHTLVLEEDKLEDEFAFIPSVDRRTKAGKAEYAEFLEYSRGKSIVTPEMFNQAELMAESVGKNEYSQGLFSGAKIEHSIYATHQPSGLQYKCRPDAWKGGVITDLKTAVDASPKAFQSSAVNYGYYLQAGMMAQAMLSIGERLDKFVFQVVEKTEPYAVATYVLDDEAVQYGINLFDELMLKYAECVASDRWPSYSLQTLELPRYVRFENE